MSDNERKDSPEQAEFRAMARAWLADNVPAESPVRLQVIDARTWDGFHGPPAVRRAQRCVSGSPRLPLLPLIRPLSDVFPNPRLCLR